MKIPTEITICGIKHKVILEPDNNGGWFNEGKKAIGIGVVRKDDIPEVILHEVLESIMAIRNMRYAKERAEPDNGDYLFSFNHDQFEQFVKDAVAALRGIKF